MSKKVFQVISIVILIVGLIIMFNSITWGSNSANAYLRAHGGGMDTAMFMVVFQEYINIYKLVGGILVVIGGLGFLRV
ncbi:hypothetical protein BBF96_08750 [Anoxybacter fermentans]|uniref:Uncharacterized protein n=1 Tax=Anoxybacter fermentans TaxID=1323375 RepID=A0A3Q9HR31_9FIRM|nr:hypothetical protein [Anoxybacter fermentans]AZR73463.1 hypothetical protein BBF96_08750 [Anoxybacter fermentans]